MSNIIFVLVKNDGKKISRKEQSEKKQNERQERAQKKIVTEKSEILEETIPAMVTIKRVAENGSSTPTVTITLKGSTPDQDKLLYTLVNGTDENASGKVTDSITNQSSSSKKKKKKKQQNNQPVPTVITKELKVTLALDSNKSNFTDPSSQEAKKLTKNNVKGNDLRKTVTKQNLSKKDDACHNDIQIPMLRLPPGTEYVIIAKNKLY